MPYLDKLVKESELASLRIGINILENALDHLGCRISALTSAEDALILQDALAHLEQQKYELTRS